MGVSIDKNLKTPDEATKLGEFATQHELAFGVSYSFADKVGNGRYVIRLSANSFDYRLVCTIRTPGEGTEEESSFLQAVIESVSGLSCKMTSSHLITTARSSTVQVRNSHNDPTFTTAVKWSETQRDDDRLVQALSEIAISTERLSGFTLERLNFGVSCHAENWGQTKDLLSGRFPTWDLGFQGKYLDGGPKEAVLPSTGYFRFPVAKSITQQFATWIDLVVTPSVRFIEYQADTDLGDAFPSLSDAQVWEGEFANRWGLTEL